MERLKKHAWIIGAILGIATMAGGAWAFNNSIIDGRVKIQLVGMAQKSDIKALDRKFTGFQRQVNKAVNDNKLFKEKLKSSEDKARIRQKGLDDRLNLIMKYIEKNQ